MQCNIDQRGRRVRMMWGIAMLALAAAVVYCGWTGLIGPWWAGVTALVFAAAGIFGVYEARKGWCAVRALGFKTPV